MTVIRVAFGPGGGRVAAESALPEPVRRFTRTEVTSLCGLSLARLRALERAHVVSPTGRPPSYSFGDLGQLRVVQGLLRQGISLASIVRAVRAVRLALPAVAAPLSALRFEVEGKRLVVSSKAGAFEPLTGQGVLDLEPPRQGVLHVMRPSEGRERAREAYDLYLRASGIDEDDATMKEAEALYCRAIELDPYLAIAYTNLGNIHHRRLDPEAAEVLYRKALELAPLQPEALYNLGYILLSRDEPTAAIPLLESALASDPEFADAYFNLARALEELGRDDEAQGRWRQYLQLEPKGHWAEMARRHLR